MTDHQLTDSHCNFKYQEVIVQFTFCLLPEYSICRPASFDIVLDLMLNFKGKTEIHSTTVGNSSISNYIFSIFAADALKFSYGLFNLFFLPNFVLQIIVLDNRF